MLRSVFLAVTCTVAAALASHRTYAEQMPDGGYLGSPHALHRVALESEAAEIDWLDGIQRADFASIHPTYLSSSGSHGGEFYAGVELVMVKPYWEDEVDTLKTILVLNDVEFPNDPVRLDPEYNCSLSPRVYVGYRNADGLGVSVRYWIYDESANTLKSDEFGQELTLNANLNVQALDLQAAKLLTDGMFSLELGGGVRYGKTEVEASLLAESPGSTSSVMGRATFEGVGPTIFTEAQHRLGRSGFSLVGNVRGSLLFGHSKSGADVSPTGIGFDNSGAADLVPVIETQVGAEYARNLGNGRLALRALMEGQWWGVSTPGASFSRDLQFPGSNQTDLSTTGRDLGFFGVTAGVVYEY